MKTKNNERLEQASLVLSNGVGNILGGSMQGNMGNGMINAHASIRGQEAANNVSTTDFLRASHSGFCTLHADFHLLLVIYMTCVISVAEKWT